MKVMKTKILFIVALMLGLTSFAAEPNEKILKNFSHTFPKAEGIVWYESETEYAVYFTNDGIKCRVWYDAEGSVKKSIRYYGEEKLPPMIIASLQKKFPGTKVFGITEYSTPEEFTYQVTLEDEKKWYTVHADATGGSKLINKMNKSEK